MNYALVENGVVTNLIWLHSSNADEFPDAVQLNDIPVAIGDTYVDGVFYREGVKVLTAVEAVQAEADEMREALALLGVSVNE